MTLRPRTRAWIFPPLLMATIAGCGSSGGDTTGSASPAAPGGSAGAGGSDGASGAAGAGAGGAAQSGGGHAGGAGGSAGHGGLAGSGGVAGTSAAGGSAGAFTCPAAQRSTIAAGNEHACAIRSGALYCWGSNHDGQLGLGDQIDRVAPTLVPGLPEVVEVSATVNYYESGATCVLDKFAFVWCTGRYDTVLAPVSTFTKVSVFPSAVRVTAAPAYVCVIRDGDGRVFCETRTEDPASGPGFPSDGKPHMIDGLPAVAATKLVAGEHGACVSLENGEVWCWGGNSAGQLGAPGPSSAVAVRVLTAQGDCPPDLSYVGDSVCAAFLDHSIQCWGDNSYDSLDVGVGAASTVAPTVITTQGLALRLDGGATACALQVDGTVKCWGSNLGGAAANGNYQEVGDHPVTIQGLAGVRELEGGEDFYCARTDDDAVWCWGADYSGQLGTGSSPARSTPTKVSGVSGATSIAVGGDRPTVCAASADGIKCWGDNAQSLVRTPFSYLPEPLPVPLPGTAGVGALSVGDGLACGLSSGSVVCWGYAVGGPPVTMAGTSGVTSIAVSGNAACALTTTGVSCWGSDANGELGDGGALVQSMTPVAIDLPATPTSVVPGNFGMLAIVGGDIWTWGDALPSLSPPNTHPKPAKLAGFSGVTAVASSTFGVCAIDAAGDVRCANPHEGKPTPAVVAGVSSAKALAMGSAYACALAGGIVTCWGDNGVGELGQGDTETHATAVSVPGLTGVVAISAGPIYDSTCALLADGTVWCWGGVNRLGEMGDGTAGGAASPVQVVFP